MVISSFILNLCFIKMFCETVDFSLLLFASDNADLSSTNLKYTEQFLLHFKLDITQSNDLTFHERCFIQVKFCVQKKVHCSLPIV